jgi:hypothetical protein
MSTSLPAILRLVRDPFGQTLASGTFWLLPALSALATALCLTVVVAGDDRPPPLNMPREDLEQAYAAVADLVTARLGQDAGAPRLPLILHSRPYKDVTRHLAEGMPPYQPPVVLTLAGWPVLRAAGGRQAVQALELVLAGWMVDGVGVLLILVWTAGFVPTFLEPRSLAVLLVKPLPRWGLLAGPFLGVLALVAFQGALFLGGTWLALGLRTGVWEGAYFLGLPLLLLHFGVFFSASLLLAVTTRSTVACVFGSVLFWLVCLGVNLGRHAALQSPALQGLAPGFGWLLETSYWLLPKPLDFHFLLVEALQGPAVVDSFVDLKNLGERGLWQPGLSVLTSVTGAAALLALAAHDFLTADY